MAWSQLSRAEDNTHPAVHLSTYAPFGVSVSSCERGKYVPGHAQASFASYSSRQARLARIDAPPPGSWPFAMGARICTSHGRLFHVAPLLLRS
jgi:hypothetical protein